MANAVRVLTDSTAYLPQEILDRHRLTSVPLQVVVDGRSYDEGDLGGTDVAEALRRRRPVTTSRPSPARLLAAYERLAHQGATEIVSVHLSAAVSGTYEAAGLAARDAPVPVHVVDSRALGMALGYLAVSAAELAERGLDGAQVADAVRRLTAGVQVYFYVDTLEHLRRGGRITAAQALIGSALAVKPLLTLEDGRIVPLEKVRTATRALARLEDLTVAAAGHGARVAVHHLDSAQRADALVERLRARLGPGPELVCSEIGPVIGAHVGPGMVGAVVVPATPDLSCTGG